MCTTNPSETFRCRRDDPESSGNLHLDDVAKMLDRLQNIEMATERAAMLTKQMMESPLPEPPMDLIGLLRNAVGRTRYTPLPGIMEMQCTWLQVRGRLRGAPDCMDGVRDGNVGGGLASPFPFLGATILRSLSLLVAEKKPPILRLCARHVHADPDGFVPVRLGTLDRQCDGL